MALNFPDNPTTGQLYADSTSGFTYQWDGVVWKSYTASSSKNISIVDNIESSFNGSTQTFALTVSGVSLTPANAQQLRVVLGGIVQEPLTDYTVSGSNITFTTAPSAGLDCSIVSLGPAVAVSVPGDGTVTPAKLSTGGPSWNTSGDVVITGTGTTALLVNGNARVTGILTVGTSSITLDGTNNTINVGTLSISQSGISGGTPDVTARNISGVAATFTGNVSVGGTLTYEDVTNVDSIGIVTARSGIVLTGGNATLGTGVTISGSTANVFTVSTNGSERVKVDSSGRLLVGTSSARSNFFNTTSFSPQLQLEGTGTAQILSVTSSDTVYGPYLILARQKSGSVGGNTLVGNNDLLGSVDFQGSDGTEFIAGGQIRCEVDGTPGANDMPGRLVFSTTADGASSPTERMRITSNGSVIQNYYVYDSYNAAGFITGAGTYIGGDNAPGIGLAYRGGSNANAGVISFGGLSTNGNSKTLAAIIVTQDNTATNRANGYLRFYTNRDGATDASATPIERVRFTDRILCDVTTITSLTSERRLKQDIDSAPLSPEISWNVARDLPIRSFAYKNNPESTNYGYIVDEVEAVDPSLIFDTGETDDEGSIRSYDNAKLQAMYHLALKQALTKIETLEAKVAALESA